jgi:hypothetical protein
MVVGVQKVEHGPPGQGIRVATAQASRSPGGVDDALVGVDFEQQIRRGEGEGDEAVALRT